MTDSHARRPAHLQRLLDQHCVSPWACRRCMGGGWAGWAGWAPQTPQTPSPAALRDTREAMFKNPHDGSFLPCHTFLIYFCYAASYFCMILVVFIIKSIFLCINMLVTLRFFLFLKESRRGVFLWSCSVIYPHKLYSVQCLEFSLNLFAKMIMLMMFFELCGHIKNGTLPISAILSALHPIICLFHILIYH